MNPHFVSDTTVALLEFSSITAELLHYCLTEEGRSYTSALPLHTEEATIVAECKLVAEWRALLEYPTLLSGLTFPSIEYLPARARSHTPLTPQECAALRQWIQDSRILTQRIGAHIKDTALAQRYASLPSLSDIESAIDAVVDSTGAVRVDHIPQLQRARHTADAALTHARESAAATMQRHPQWWNGDQPVFREHRIVLPLNTEYHRHIEGLHHSHSDSGSTVFIEPYAMVEKNNRWIKAESHFERQLQLVLHQLSARIFKRMGTISHYRKKWGFLDSLYARACYSRSHRCVSPRGAPQTLRLLQARHPLLGQHAVPVDITVSPPQSVLVICGPNAGGKSVALKTIALIVYMYHCGMEVPVAEGSTIPYIDRLFVEMGDQQSIQSAHSTFSAQMASVAELLQRATARSLVLLDEIGAHTDPHQGAALAYAVIEACRKQGTLTVATTHLSLLKEYAVTTPGVDIAAVACDPRTLTPTYRIIPHHTEESHALRLAARAGVPPAVIDEAERYARTTQGDTHDRVARIVSLENRLTARAAAVESRHHALQEKERSLEERANALLEQKTTAFDTVIAEATALVAQLSAALGRALHQSEIQHELQTARARLREIERTAPTPHTPPPAATPTYRIGDRVTILQNGAVATVIGVDSHQRCELQHNAIRIKLPASQIAPLAHPDPQAHPTVQIETQHTPTASRTIDLHGHRVHEIEAILLRKLDGVIVSGHPQCEIVHGIGSGALCREVARLLKEHPRIRRWEFAPADQGGRGKTIAYFD